MRSNPISRRLLQGLNFEIGLQKNWKMDGEGMIVQRCLSADTPRSVESSLLLTESPSGYHQRDLLPSHIYRVGVKIFNKTPAYRTRLIDTTLCKQRLNLIPHPIMSKRLHDLKAAKSKDATPQADTPLQETIRKTEKKSPSAFTTTDYSNWISNRQQLRSDLDKLGANEKWLSNKECTPIEATLLEKLQTERWLAGRKVVPPTPVEVSRLCQCLIIILFYFVIRAQTVMKMSLPHQN